MVFTRDEPTAAEAGRLAELSEKLRKDPARWARATESRCSASWRGTARRDGGTLVLPPELGEGEVHSEGSPGAV